MKKIIFIYAILGTVFLSCKDCFDDGSLPNNVYPIETFQATNIFYNRATLAAVHDSTMSVEEKGFFFSDEPFSSSNQGTKLVSKSSGNYFTYFVNTLKIDNSYYFKSFVKTPGGEMIFGKEMIFRTDRVVIDEPAAPVGTVEVLDGKRLKLMLKTASLGNEKLSSADQRTVTVKVSALGLYYWKQGEDISNAKRVTMERLKANEVEVNKTATFISDEFTPGTKYQYQLFIQTETIRSYATAFSNDVLGEKGEFTTPSIELGVVKMESERITTTKIILNGKVISYGNDPEAVVGFYYGTSSDNLNTKVEAEKIEDNNTFNVFMKNLSAKTTYYVKPFIINDKGESTGEVRQLTTADVSKPIMAVNFMNHDYRVNNIKINAARIRGEIFSDGGKTILAYGLYWGTDATNITKQINGSELNEQTGLFYVNISDLSTGKVYYYKTFAKNELGETVGEIQEIRMPVSGGKQYMFDASSNIGNSFMRMIESNTELYYWEADPITTTDKTYYFLDRNLGATEIFTKENYNTTIANNDNHWAAIGYHYQFGLGKPSSTPATEGMRITGALSTFGWSNSGGPVGQFWSNPICPEGYTMISRNDMNQILSFLPSKNLDVFFDLIGLGVTGQRAAGNGGMGPNTAVSAFWLYDSANTAGTGQGYYLNIPPNGNAVVAQGGRYLGFPVRCVRVVNN